jgi:hypothetical protein
MKANESISLYKVWPAEVDGWEDASSENWRSSWSLIEGPGGTSDWGEGSDQISLWMTESVWNILLPEVQEKRTLYQCPMYLYGWTMDINCVLS